MSENKKQYLKQYRQSPNGKKSNTICKWKHRGLIGDYEKIYNRYINTTHCDLCNILLNKKYMEHNHYTGEFRNIVCQTCNTNKSDRKKQTNNTSGYKNIFYCKSTKDWVYKKIFKGKYIRKYSKNKIDILCIKFAGIILYNY